MRVLTHVACTLVFAGVLFAQEDIGPKPLAPGIAPKAKGVVDAMGAFYKSLNSVTCSFDLDFKMEGNGESDSASLDCKVAVERPNKVSLVQGESKLGLDLVSDGTNLAISIPQLKKYTVIAAPGGIQEIFLYSAVNGITSFTGIIGELMSPDPAVALLEGAVELTYVGLEDLNNQKHHRVRLSREESVMDLWIADGEKPYLGKMVPDLSQETEQTPMKVSIDVKLGDWTGNAPIPAATFAFTPPTDSTKEETFEAMLTGDAEPRPAMTLIGTPAPAFKLSDLDGKIIDLASYKGKNIVVLDFWATWCGPCVKAMPIIAEVTSTFKDKDVVLIAVNQAETVDEIKTFLKDNKLDVTVALDEDQSVAELYKVTGIPQTVIIGKDGSVQSVHIGVSPGLKSELTHELTELSEGRALVK